MRTTLRMTKADHKRLEAHLFPGDGCEAVAVALCGRRRGTARHVLTIRDIAIIPYNECKVRTPERVTWSTARLEPLLHKAANEDLAILKIHSHPGGYPHFSETDDAADEDIFNSIFGWTDSKYPHASAIMLPGGTMFGRTIFPNGAFAPLDSILIPGDDIEFWTSSISGHLPSFTQRHAQLFGSATTQRLRDMAVAVIGCSGTGSPLIEMLVRLGIGRIIIVDPDRVEDKNLNRIVNSTREDAYLKRLKVESMARAIAAMGFGTEVEIYPCDLASPDAVRAVAECDVVFGCMDGVEGRHLLSRLVAYYVLPYFDVGVRLEADGQGGIQEACGAVHYCRPDGSTLFDRGVYTMGQVKAAGLRRTDPEAYRDHIKRGYIHGIAEDRPAVISINMQIASLAVNEFLARLHPYRLDDNAESAIVRVSFMQSHTYRSNEPHASDMFATRIGHGDVVPLLGVPELSDKGGKS